MPDAAQLVEIDRAVASANAGKFVDLPSGIGFCLYVRRDCLDAVGPLSTAFGRGYCEDVEFCLRVTDAGFRNVCATDTFVAHAGSQTFREERRALVVRNLRKIDVLYPAYRRASAAFVAADPLRTARGAVTKQIPPPPTPERLRVANESHGPCVAGRIAPSRVRLGIFVTDRSETTVLRLVGLVDALRMRGVGGMVVLGRTHDALRAMSATNIFVAGAVAPEELRDVALWHRTTHVAAFGNQRANVRMPCACVTYIGHVQTDETVPTNIEAYTETVLRGITGSIEKVSQI